MKNKLLLIILVVFAAAAVSTQDTSDGYMQFKDDSVKVYYEDLKDNRPFVSYEQFPYAMHDVEVYYETFNHIDNKKSIKPLNLFRIIRLITLGIN